MSTGGSVGNESVVHSCTEKHGSLVWRDSNEMVEALPFEGQGGCEPDALRTSFTVVLENYKAPNTFSSRTDVKIVSPVHPRRR